MAEILVTPSFDRILVVGAPDDLAELAPKFENAGADFTTPDELIKLKTPPTGTKLVLFVDGASGNRWQEVNRQTRSRFNPPILTVKIGNVSQANLFLRDRLITLPPANRIDPVTRSRKHKKPKTPEPDSVVTDSVVDPVEVESSVPTESFDWQKFLDEHIPKNGKYNSTILAKKLVFGNAVLRANGVTYTMVRNYAQGLREKAIAESKIKMRSILAARAAERRQERIAKELHKQEQAEQERKKQHKYLLGPAATVSMFIYRNMDLQSDLPWETQVGDMMKLLNEAGLHPSEVKVRETMQSYRDSLTS